MLEHCAPGFTKTETDHHWCVRFGTKTYPSLPLGKHGPRHDPTVQIGKVRKLARILGIADCARGQLEQLH
jgi:hypothetical protein